MALGQRIGDLIISKHFPKQQISPIAVGERLATLLPNAVLKIIPGGDHGFVYDRPEAIVDDILGHLA